MKYNLSKFRVLKAIDVISNVYNLEPTNHKISILTGMNKKYLKENIWKYNKLGYINNRVSRDKNDRSHYSYYLSKKGKNILTKLDIYYNSGYSLHLKKAPVKIDYSDVVILPGFDEFEDQYIEKEIEV